MINSHLCIDCICVAVCINKTIPSLLDNCSLIKNSVLNICASMSMEDLCIIHLKGLDRKIKVRTKDGDNGVYAISDGDRS